MLDYVYRLKKFFFYVWIEFLFLCFFNDPFFFYVGHLHSISLQYFLRIFKKQNIFLLSFFHLFSFLTLSFLISPPTLISISRKPIVRRLIKLTHTHLKINTYINKGNNPPHANGKHYFCLFPTHSILVHVLREVGAQNHKQTKWLQLYYNYLCYIHNSYHDSTSVVF